MGANISDCGVISTDLELLAGPESVDSRDKLWSRVEVCEITVNTGGEGTRKALDRAGALWAGSLYSNHASGNLKGMIGQMVRLLARCTTADYAHLQESDVIGALNYVALVRTAAKYHVENLNPHQFFLLYYEQIEAIVEGVELLLMADCLHERQVEPESRAKEVEARKWVQWSSRLGSLAYALRCECVLMLLVLAASQLTSPLSTTAHMNDPQHQCLHAHPFMSCMMKRSAAQARAILGALLAHYMHTTEGSFGGGGGVRAMIGTAGSALSSSFVALSSAGLGALSSASYISRLALALPVAHATVSAQAYEFAQQLAAKALRGKDPTSSLLSERCGYLLLVLLNYLPPHSNAYRLCSPLVPLI